jgi:hypothetical protein
MTIDAKTITIFFDVLIALTLFVFLMLGYPASWGAILILIVRLFYSHYLNYIYRN